MSRRMVWHFGRTITYPSLEVISKRIIVPHKEMCQPYTFLQRVCTQDRESFLCPWPTTGIEVVANSNRSPWVALGTQTLTTFYNQKPPPLSGSFPSMCQTHINMIKWRNNSGKEISMLLLENNPSLFSHPGSCSRWVRIKRKINVCLCNVKQIWQIKIVFQLFVCEV